MKKYYIAIDGDQKGPFTIEQLKEIDLKKDTPIWTEELTEWATVANLPEVVKILPPSLPPPLKIVENKPPPPPPLRQQIEQNKQPAPQPTPTPKKVVESKPKKKRTWIKVLVAMSGLMLLVFFILRSLAYAPYSPSGIDSSSDQFKQEVEEILKEREAEKERNRLAIEVEENRNRIEREAEEQRDSIEREAEEQRDSIAREIKSKQDRLERKHLELERAESQKRYDIATNIHNHVKTNVVGFDNDPVFGGIWNIRVKIRNDTDYELEQVMVQVNYITTFSDVYKREYVTAYNVKPRGRVVLSAPTSKKGTKITCKLSQVASSQLGL